jgi:type I restriction enzyme S subunit
MLEIQLPEGWRVQKLSEISQRIHYGFTASSTSENTGVQLVRITDIQDYKVNWPSVPFCSIKPEDFQKYRLSSGDLLFARTGATVGKSYLVKGPVPDSVFASYLIRVVLGGSVDRQYIFLYFQSPYYWEQIKASSVGIGQPNVNGTILAQLTVPVPPLPVQRAIVARIEELFSELDAGVQELKTALARLKTYRQAVLHHYLNNPDWERVKLGTYIQSITSGKSFSCEERPPRDGEFGVAKVSAVTWGQYNEQESKTCLDSSRFVERYLIRPGDFLFSRANTIELVGACVIAEQVTLPVMLSDKILRIRFDLEKLDPRYSMYFLRSRVGRNEIERLATGNQESMRNIGQDRIRQIEIPLPDLSSQIQIVSEIEARLSEADAVETTIRQELARAENLRQSILKQAFSGQLVTAPVATVEPVGTEELERPASGVRTSSEQLSLF